MTKLSITVLISLAVVVQYHIPSTAYPAGEMAMAAPAAPAESPEMTDKEPAEAPNPAPKGGETAPPPTRDCVLYVGTTERKLKQGCQICWAPPEFLICKNGDWDFGSCSDGMKCQHTSECTTTCVPKPADIPKAKPVVQATSESGGSMNNTLHRCKRGSGCPFANP